MGTHVHSRDWASSGQKLRTIGGIRVIYNAWAAAQVERHGLLQFSVAIEVRHVLRERRGILRIDRGGPDRKPEVIRIGVLE